MLGEGVKWFDFLCPFSLKFAALARFGPSARTSPLAPISLFSETWEIIKTFLRLEERFNFAAQMSTPQEEIRWADGVSEEIIEKSFIYSSSYRLLITSLRRFFQSGSTKRRLAKMLILGLGHNSWRDPNVNTDEEDYNEELEELNEKYGRYEETFLHRYHVTDPPGRKSLNYFDFERDVISYFKEKFSKFRISFVSKTERPIYTLPVVEVMEPRTKEVSTQLKQLVRFFAEFTANFFHRESRDYPLTLEFDGYFREVLNYFLKSKDNDRIECLYLMVLISMTRPSMFLSVNTEDVRSKIEVLSKERTFSPLGRSMLKDLLRVIRLQGSIGKNEAGRADRRKLEAFAKLFSDLIEKEDILEHHNILQQRLNEFELMDHETFTSKLKDIAENSRRLMNDILYRGFGRRRYSDNSDYDFF